jgi:CDP-glucose 4,6-dehydratase
MDLKLGAQPDPAFWRGRRVLLTGHTGFKGAWLAFWLTRLGASVSGLALAPTTRPSLFDLLDLQRQCDHRTGDIRDEALVRRVVAETQPEIVLHLAAQALVRASYQDPLGTFSTNVMGTAHVLDALRQSPSTRVAVMVTTDKVYRNREWLWPYREDDPLGGHDPYSASKAACDIAVESWRLAFLREGAVAVASARAGNVIGGGDWSADRLLPDAARAWLAGRPLVIRRPQAVRPWQHVIEPLAGYLVLAQHLWQHPEAAGAYNFGPHPHEAAPVRDVIERARQVVPQAQVEYSDSTEGPHEAGLL